MSSVSQLVLSSQFGLVSGSSANSAPDSRSEEREAEGTMGLLVLRVLNTVVSDCVGSQGGGDAR